MTDEYSDMETKARAAQNSTGPCYPSGWEPSPAAVLKLIADLREAREAPRREFSFYELETWIRECVDHAESRAVFLHLRQRICEAAARPAPAQAQRPATAGGGSNG